MTTNKSVSDILVVSPHTSTNYGEDYVGALRFAVGLVRDEIYDLEIQQVGTLHSFDEILEASDELGPNFTDEELIEEVHYASKARGQ
jgi:hypothetical protein